MRIVNGELSLKRTTIIVDGIVSRNGAMIPARVVAVLTLLKYNIVKIKMGHIFMPTFTDCGAKVGFVRHVQCWSMKSFF